MSVPVDSSLIWVEISRTALVHNLKVFRTLVGSKVKLCPTVKANAYGHGLTECAKIFRSSGADYLAVNALFEARRLREAGDTGPLYILGYTALEDLAEAVALDCELVIYNRETLAKLAEIAKKAPPLVKGGKSEAVRVHLKVETGTNRQGVVANEAVKFANEIKEVPGVELAGVSMHFANIEDTIDHNYARYQLTEFEKICSDLTHAGHKNLIRHAANSAGALLWDEAHFELVRPGIAVYGLWPSDETFTSLATERKKKIILKSVLTWKTRVAQVKTISTGAKVGYGCTWEAERDTRLAILPVGYYDGYVRAYSGRASVLIRGQRAPVIGRVCMNIIMADVTDVPDVKLEDEVVLLGKSGAEEITAEELGEWGDTINYEVTTRIREGIERRVV